MEIAPYLIGIDLGTTNTTLSYIEWKNPIEGKKNFIPRPTTFSIPQYTEGGMIQRQQTLPSVIYLLNKQEEEYYPLPWVTDSRYLIGRLAYRLGIDHPTKVILSSKSWLAHPAASQTRHLLPLEHSVDKEKLSPKQVAHIILEYLAGAWNHIMAQQSPEKEFIEQQIVLTLPASFDESARRQTLEAAQGLHLKNITLLEEPQAAFYDWLGRHHTTDEQPPLPIGSQLLICDIGGGTTDFSLLEVTHQKEATPHYRIERRAVGLHLLLGGDNIDLAIAAWVYPKLFPKRTSPDSYGLYQKIILLARRAKEEILSEVESDSDPYTILLQGSGSDLVKGSRQIIISKKEFKEYISAAFWQETPLNNPKANHTVLRDGNLPYEENTQFLYHLANFLTQQGVHQRPTHLLFNGGTLAPSFFQERILNALKKWFDASYPIEILDTQKSLHLAVSRGAALFALSQRGFFTQIYGGIPHAYYLKINQEDLVLLIPRYSQPGYAFSLENKLKVRVNQPVVFEFYASSQKCAEDVAGSLARFNSVQVRQLSGMQTFLKYGKSHASTHEIEVNLTVELTHTGIIELLLTHSNAAGENSHQWRLDFSCGEGNSSLISKGNDQSQEISQSILCQMAEALKRGFEAVEAPAQLLKELEVIAEQERKFWSARILRSLWQTHYELASHRNRSAFHGARWWNCAGFFLRPGYGHPLDVDRMNQLWKCILEGFHNPHASGDLRLQQLICYRRIALGLTRGQQQQMLNYILPLIWDRKKQRIITPPQGAHQEYSELWRLLALLEWAEPKLKQMIGAQLVLEIPKAKNNFQVVWLWVLSHLAARNLLVAPHTYLVEPLVVLEWVKILLKGLDSSWTNLSDECRENLAQMIARASKPAPYPNLSLNNEEIEKILQELSGNTQEELRDLIKRINNATSQENDDAMDSFYGEKLPSGISLITEV